MVLSSTSSTYTSFFFNDTPTTDIYTLSLHDALPISTSRTARGWETVRGREFRCCAERCRRRWVDRKSTRLNSSHTVISYAVFCLKKKKNKITPHDIKVDSGTENMTA